MASQQAFQVYPQNKGTLNPGQTISVNKHTVQVERYLSQGGFAHVYLVRTPTPVYNTTHHVLKRIQVSDESMLSEVRKEVDVMRLLKGHPNIVHLIDAAWHKMPNGMFEVFILMEYCPGGGIIDMMNRRLRERLTEAEILQIFVDVCEGVAYMHNSRPPLLHRDLKVENILQSSPTSFKLCDFGSAINVGNPPANMQEIRALEADLNRHTTLQYRAPEMVDVYSKRPINEKSDVWALGVLLYKLCYYTTPFEEHGPLAILNVQYRTPSYPLYSQDMNMLIASMLREHGSQRPTVFELLAHVHRLRGTKSKFSYNIPIPSPLSPRTQPEFKPPPSPNNLVAYTSPAKSALSLYESSSRQNQPPINQGIQARDKVLEAIAPMRRGRPGASRESKRASSSSPPNHQKTPASNQTNADKSKNWLDNDFGPEQDKVWKATERNLASSKNSADLGWTIADGQQPQKDKFTGFGDDFDRRLWNSSDPNLLGAPPTRLSPRPNLTKTAVKPSAAPIRPLAHTGGVSRTNQSAPPSKDAFEGLGLMTTTSKPAPTMGEARKLRTGLAIVNTPIIPSDYKRHDTTKVNSASRQPSLSPRPNYLSSTLSHPKSISPTPTPGTSNVSSSPKLSSLPTSGSMASATRINNGLAIESRFPSLEELDARFVPSVNLLYPSSVIDASRNLSSSQLTKSVESQSQPLSRVNYIGNSGTGGNFLKSSITPNTSHSVNGVRSEQVTGVAMRESKQSRKPENEHSSSKITPSDPDYTLLSPPRDGNFSSRPVPVKKHPTSMSTKPSLDSGKSVEITEITSYTKVINLEPPQLPPRPSQSSTPRDWLTGDDEHGGIEVPARSASEVPVWRGSPSKRTSYIELDKLGLAARATAQHAIVHDQASQEPLSADLSPTVSKFKRTFPALEMIDNQDLHPSDASDLVDGWSSAATKDSEHDSSSADEEPEDPRSLRPATLKKTSRAKGRQSSVHELVYQYGGGVAQKEKEHERERERERVVQHSLGDYVPQQPKVRPSGLVLPTTKPHMDRKTPSPTTKPLVSPISRSPQPHQSPSQANKPQPPLKANKSGRSRPQSMFIFPSKSVDSSSLPSPGLVPPEGSKPRTIRRTSISDIVERYEAIGGKTKLAGPPSPHPKPMTTKTTSTPAEPRRIHKPSISSSSSNVLLSKVPMPSDSYSNMGDDLSKSHSVSMEPPRQVPRTPTKPRKSVALEKGELIPIQTVDNSTPRSRRISRKPEPFEHVASQSLKAPFEAETSATTNSPRKLFGTDLPSSKSEDRSPSPERPYQGVGKLIDQWQKKSAEADPQPIFSGKRSGFVPKRAGIAHGDDGRSQ